MSLPMEAKTEWAVKYRLKMAFFCLFLQFFPPSMWLRERLPQVTRERDDVTRAWKPSDRLRSTKVFKSPQPSPPQTVFSPFLCVIWNSSERESAGLRGRTGAGAPRLARRALPWRPQATTGARRRRDRSRRSLGHRQKTQPKIKKPPNKPDSKRSDPGKSKGKANKSKVTLIPKVWKDLTVDWKKKKKGKKNKGKKMKKSGRFTSARRKIYLGKQPLLWSKSSFEGCFYSTLPMNAISYFLV